MELKTRKPLRLQGYDYSAAGMYFITIVTEGRKELFGRVEDDEIILSNAGKMINDAINDIAQKENGAEVTNSVVMPNHVHFVLLSTEGTPVSDIVRRFKGVTTYRYNKVAAKASAPPTRQSLWQRSYYDVIIRNERMLNYVNNYIATNPLRWHKDKFNCQCASEHDEILKELHSLR